MSEPSSSPRGPYKKGRERRRTIVEAAAQLFSEKGYTAGSMRELGTRVGLTQAGLLHHFSSKEELLTEVIRLRDESVAAALSDIDPADPIARGLGIVRHAKENPRLTSLFTVLSAEASVSTHPAHGYFTQRYETSASVTAAENGERQKAGTMRGDIDPATIATIMTSVLDGLQLQRAYRPELDAEQVIAALWAMLEPPTADRDPMT